MEQPFSSWGKGKPFSDKTSDDRFFEWIARHTRNDASLDAELEARSVVEMLCSEELAEVATLSESTQQLYLNEVRGFAKHCNEIGIAAAPAGPGVVAMYLVGKIADGISWSRARRILAAIGDLHTAGGHPDPTAG